MASINSHIEAMERNSRDHLKKPLHIHLKLVCIPVLHTSLCFCASLQVCRHAAHTALVVMTMLITFTGVTSALSCCKGDWRER